MLQKLIKVNNMGKIMRVPKIIFIFAASWRGKWLRRGATIERYETDKGKRLDVCNFDQQRGPP